MESAEQPLSCSLAITPVGLSEWVEQAFITEGTLTDGMKDDWRMPVTELRTITEEEPTAEERLPFRRITLLQRP